jgi:hypothetical protein
MRGKLAELAVACEAVDRDPSTLEITMIAAQPDVAKLEQYAEIGAHRCVFLLPSDTADVVLPALDRLAQVMEQTGL